MGHQRAQLLADVTYRLIVVFCRWKFDIWEANDIYAFFSRPYKNQWLVSMLYHARQVCATTYQEGSWLKSQRKDRERSLRSWRLQTPGLSNHSRLPKDESIWLACASHQLMGASHQSKYFGVPKNVWTVSADNVGEFFADSLNIWNDIIDIGLEPYEMSLQAIDKIQSIIEEILTVTEYWGLEPFQ